MYQTVWIITVTKWFPLCAWVSPNHRTHQCGLQTARLLLHLLATSAAITMQEFRLEQVGDPCKPQKLEVGQPNNYCKNKWNRSVGQSLGQKDQRRRQYDKDWQGFEMIVPQNDTQWMVTLHIQNDQTCGSIGSPFWVDGCGIPRRWLTQHERVEKLNWTAHNQAAWQWLAEIRMDQADFLTISKRIEAAKPALKIFKYLWTTALMLSNLVRSCEINIEHCSEQRCHDSTHH